MEDTLRIDYIPLAKLLRAPRNPKRHDLDVIEKSVRRFGYVNPVIIDGRTGRLVAGAGRLDTLDRDKASGLQPPRRIRQRRGEWLVPTIIGIDFEDDLEAEAYLLADNQSTILGGWDESLLKESVDELGSFGRLDGTGFEQPKGGTDSGMPALAEDEIPDVSRFDELLKKWQVEIDQLWEAGPHKLYCGDSRKQNIFEGWDTIFTDPPYGIQYESRWVPEYGPIRNDDLSAADLVIVLREAIPEATARFVTCNWKSYPVFLEAFGEPRSLCVWIKNYVGLGRHYRHQHEFIMFHGALPPQDPLGYERDHEFIAFQGTLEQKDLTDVWHFDRVNVSQYQHPTEKPVALVGKALRDVRASIVYDPFLGSGTTILAAAQSNAIGYGIELDPRYFAVALERLQNYGLSPRRLKHTHKTKA